MPGYFLRNRNKWLNTKSLKTYWNIMKVNLKNEKPKKHEARVRIKIFLVCASVEASSLPSSKATKESLLLDYYHALLQRVEL